ncbi:MAG: formylglycine-generating enzyme family protein [Lentisphaerae bacterium]|nr:formylglycine-generating enzyme family protein [Lentisphaerota bacterium]
MKRWLAVAGLLAALALPAGAWRPAGWVYADYPWLYDQASGDWYWLNIPNTQWVYGFPPANGWAKIQSSGLGWLWAFWQWPYAYDQGQMAWYYINEADTQWVVNMRTGEWSVLGQHTAPAGMLEIPGGTNEGTDPDFGAYSIRMEMFYMDRFEVTKALWDSVHAWAVGHGYTFENAGEGKATNHPVHSVSWYDSVKWCNARSEKEGRELVYFRDAAYTIPYRTGRVDAVQARVWADGYRLPTGAFAANGYGLHEMIGNIWEWCFDWHPDYVGQHRMLRGGNWSHSAWECRAGNESYWFPEGADTMHGLRTVVSGQ